MELRAGQDPREVIKVLRHLRIQLSNAVSSGGWEARDAYVSAIESAEVQMRNLWVGTEWLERLMSERYWRIRELHRESLRPVPLIRHEAEHQIVWLDELTQELKVQAQEDEAADPAAVRAILDTNVHLHFRPFTDIDWPRELRQPSVRLVVPLLVIRELDDHKNEGGKIGHRAATRLEAMRRLLAGKGRGPVGIRQGVTLEVLLDPRRHEPQPNNDEEILARAEALSARLGGPLMLITGDLSMQLRAEARGLQVAFLGDHLRLPQS